MDKNIIVKKVLNEFAHLAEIPRPSGHEKKVSDYLAARLRKLGLTVEQDNFNNIIADKKAAPGCEKMPLIMLQSHMDMVCVAAAGVSYDPLNDPIKIKNDGKFLSAEGTSLGADDGIGIASILCILQQDFAHGPLRIIFTVDEEQGMTGARGLDKKYLQKVKYLINCDSEDYDTVTVASAGSVRVNFERNCTWKTAPTGKSARLSIKNLLGGHSGTEINKNRGNANKMLALILRTLQEEKITFSIADIKGGVADNAIASEAYADIVYEPGSEERIKEIIEQYKKDFTQVYAHTEKNITVDFAHTEKPTKVMTAEDASALVILLCLLHSGVYAMSQISDGLPELSSNIGRIMRDGDKVIVRLLARSAANANLAFLKQSYRALSSVSGFDAVFAPTSPAWNGNPESVLTRTATKIFATQNDKPMRVEFIHGGLECNYFADKNPALDIISIGPNNIDIHTPQERLQLDTIAPQVMLMQEVIAALARDNK